MPQTAAGVFDLRELAGQPIARAAHVEHILNKLGFVSRTQIGVWASEHGLVVHNLP